MLRSVVFSSLALCFLVVGGATFAQSPSTYEILHPTNDIQLDLWQPDVNTNGQGLGEYHINGFPEDWGFDLGCPARTRQTYIQFDLSSVPFDIGQARVRIYPTAGWPEVVDSYDLLFLMGYSGSWDETVVTYDNPPELSLERVFDLYSSAHDSGAVDFTEEEANPYDNLGEWLRDSQVQNGGDGMATIGFEGSAFLGCWADEDPDTGGLLFSDKESGVAPTLEVVPVGESLPELVLTSVEMSDAALSTSSNLMVVVIAVATLGITVLTIGFKKRATKGA